MSEQTEQDLARGEAYLHARILLDLLTPVGSSPTFKTLMHRIRKIMYYIEKGDYPDA